MKSEAVQLVRDDQLMRLLLGGYTLKECAKQMGLSYATVCKYAKTGNFLARLKELSSTVWAEVDHELQTNANDLIDRIQDASDKALKVLEDLMTGEGVKDIVRYKAASDVLDRNPDSAKNRRIDMTARHSFMNPEMLRQAARVAQETDDMLNGGGGTGSESDATGEK